MWVRIPPPLPNIMNRRKFLEFLGKGVAGVTALIVVPEVLANTEKVYKNQPHSGLCNCPKCNHHSAWTVAKGFPRKHKI